MVQIPPSTPTPALPLQLDEFFLTRLNVDWRNPPSDGEYKATHLDIQVSYDLAHHADIPHAYQMTLSVSGEDVVDKAPDIGYKFVAVIVGRYRIENAKAEIEPRFARVNGVSLLYSTLRGILGSVTGSFEFGKLTLPSINPVAIVDQAEKAKLAAQKPDSAAPIAPSPTPPATVAG